MRDENTNLLILKEIVRNIRDQRDWEQFHDLKNLALGLSIEAGELNELFLWKTKEEISKKIAENPEYAKKIRDEFSDIFTFCLHFANAANIDITSAFLEKLEEMKAKYPIEKSKGNATKYTEL